MCVYTASVISRRGNIIELEAIGHGIESELHKRVKTQVDGDKFYIRKTVSENAHRAFMDDDNLNELIAEVLLQEEKGIKIEDDNLLALVRRCVE